ncbi:hypothetical protein ACFSAV_07175 [Pasteurella oralis]|uniref:Outer membrane protein beta-barrel domain-containing protein n=1 Tax=Pasteurella oralis TaxID=1071947 RepID=A0ABW4NU42_9PAST
MKSKLFILKTLSLVSVLATAQTGEFNFYGKAGIDLTSRFETMRVRLENIDFPTSASTKKNTFSPSIFLETTYNVLPQLEVGLGTGYIKRKGFDHSASINEPGGIIERETYKINRYSSIPLYLTLKHSFAINDNAKIYYKSDFGYSFNKIRNTSYAIRSYKGKDIVQPEFKAPIHMKAKNGLYLGLAIGIEYQSFLAELGYYHTNSAITYQSDYRPQHTKHVHNSYKNDALRLSFGIKF